MGKRPMETSDFPQPLSSACLCLSGRVCIDLSVPTPQSHPPPLPHSPCLRTKTTLGREDEGEFSLSGCTSCLRDGAGFDPSSRTEMFGSSGRRDGFESSGTRRSFERSASEGARRKSSKVDGRSDRAERGVGIQFEAASDAGRSVQLGLQEHPNGPRDNLEVGSWDGDNWNSAAANHMAAGQGKLHRKMSWFGRSQDFARVVEGA